MIRYYSEYKILMSNVQKSWITKIKLLYGLSGNLCAFPKCMTKMIQQNNVITSAIAHIEGKKKGSARYNSSMTDEQRDDITNLILLCPTHHVLVDQDPITYTIKYLKQIKFEHEKSMKDKEQYNIPDSVLEIVSISVNTDEYSIERIHNLLKLYKTIEGNETKKLWHQHFPYVLKGLKISSTLSVNEKEALNIIFKEIFELKLDGENIFQDLLLDFLDKVPDEIRNDYISKIKPYIESILYKDFENIHLPRLYAYLDRSAMETVTYLIDYAQQFSEKSFNNFIDIVKIDPKLLAENKNLFLDLERKLWETLDEAEKTLDEEDDTRRYNNIKTLVTRFLNVTI